MTQTKKSTSTDSFQLAVSFRLEGHNLRGITLRLLGLIAAAMGIAAKVWTLIQASAS